MDFRPVFSQFTRDLCVCVVLARRAGERGRVQRARLRDFCCSRARDQSFRSGRLQEQELLSWLGGCAARGGASGSRCGSTFRPSLETTLLSHERSVILSLFRTRRCDARSSPTAACCEEVMSASPLNKCGRKQQEHAFGFLRHPPCVTPTQHETGSASYPSVPVCLLAPPLLTPSIHRSRRTESFP